MNRDTMIKWLSENTTREQWSFDHVFTLPKGCQWFTCSDPVEKIVRSAVKCVEDIKLEDVFCEPVPKGDGSITDYINNSRECFKLSIRPDQWGHCGLPLGWKWSDTNHDMNTIIEHDDLITKFNYSDIFGVGEMPPVKPAPILTPEALRERYIVTDDKGVPIKPCPTLTPGPIQAPDTDTLYWDKHNKKYCYIVGSAWDDGALFFAEEFVDGDVTGNYFATERMNLVNGDIRASIIDMLSEERGKTYPTDNLSVRIADRILNEVINCD